MERSASETLFELMVPLLEAEPTAVGRTLLPATPFLSAAIALMRASMLAAYAKAALASAPAECLQLNQRDFSWLYVGRRIRGACRSLLHYVVDKSPKLATSNEVKDSSIFWVVSPTTLRACQYSRYSRCRCQSHRGSSRRGDRMSTTT